MQWFFFWFFFSSFVFDINVWLLQWTEVRGPRLQTAANSRAMNSVQVLSRQQQQQNQNMPPSHPPGLVYMPQINPMQSPYYNNQPFFNKHVSGLTKRFDWILNTYYNVCVDHVCLIGFFFNFISFLFYRAHHITCRNNILCKYPGLAHQLLNILRR